MNKFLLFFLFSFGFLEYCLAQSKTTSSAEYIIHLPQFSEASDALNYLFDHYNTSDAEIISRNFRYYLVRFDSNQTNFKKNTSIEPDLPSLFPNVEMTKRSNVTPNDPLLADQYYLDIVQAFETWDITTGGFTTENTPVVLGVFEAGIDFSNSDLAEENFYTNPLEISDNGIDDDNNGFIDDFRGFNVTYDGDNHISDIPADDEHGTGVSGVIGASTDNSTSLSGLIWDPSLLAITGRGFDVATWIRGLDYIYTTRKLFNDTNGEKGAFVVAWNMSWGIDDDYTTGEYPQFCNLFDSLGAEGILSIGATTNRNYDVDDTLSNGVLKHPDIPSNCPSDYLIVVTSSDENDAKAPGGYGMSSVDLFAPGEDVPVLDIESSTIESGTSFATPMVTAAVGLMYSVPRPGVITTALNNPAQTAIDIKNLLLESVDILPQFQEMVTSNGRLNIFEAVKRADNYFFTVDTKPNLSRKDLFTSSMIDDNLEVTFQSQLARDRKIMIYDLIGRPLVSEKTNENRVSFSTSDWVAGIYFISVIEDNQFTTKKIQIISRTN